MKIMLTMSLLLLISLSMTLKSKTIYRAQSQSNSETTYQETYLFNNNLKISLRITVALPQGTFSHSRAVSSTKTDSGMLLQWTIAGWTRTGFQGDSVTTLPITISGIYKGKQLTTTIDPLSDPNLATKDTVGRYNWDIAIAADGNGFSLINHLPY